MTIHYVAGLLFSLDRRRLALVMKNRPAKLAGCLNAIGGKIEPGEDAHLAMVREFREETGVTIEAWAPVAHLYGPDFTVEFFAAFSDRVHEVRTMEDEQILTAYVTDAMIDRRVVRNLPVIISLALDQSGIVKPVSLSDGIANASACPKNQLDRVNGVAA